MRFLSSVCIAAIAAALFKMLVPECKAAKQVSLLIAAVFMLTLLTSAAGAEIDLGSFSVQETEYEDLSQGVNKSLQKRICGDFEEKVRGLLNAQGFFPEQIHVVVNISGLYSISITQVKLVFAPQDAAAAESACEYLAGELGGDIKIVGAVKE